MVTTQGTIFRRRPAPIHRLKETVKAAVALPQLTEEATEVIYSLSSLFPFDFFPDKVIIRLHHVDIVRGIFFWSGATERIQIIDIREVQVHYNPFFATLTIVPIAPPPDTIISLRFLWRHQALRAKRLIMGLLECHHEQVDLSTYPKQELIKYVEEIGRAKY